MPIDHAAVHRAWVERMLREDPLPSIDRRCMYMGLILKLEERTYHPEFDIHEAYSGQFALKPYVQFRVQLLWRPMPWWCDAATRPGTIVGGCSIGSMRSTG